LRPGLRVAFGERNAQTPSWEGCETPPYIDFAQHLTNAMADAPEKEVPEKSEEQKRFETELEFVQCLGSPAYLHCKSPQITSLIRQ
jgi:hypothetical protein